LLNLPSAVTNATDATYSRLLISYREPNGAKYRGDAELAMSSSYTSILVELPQEKKSAQ
jgi:hypothetical protein